MTSPNEKSNPQPAGHDAHPNPLNGNPNQYYAGSSIYDSTPAPSNNGDAKPQAPVPPTEPLVFLPVHSRPLSSYTHNPNDDAQPHHSSHSSGATLSRTLKPLHSLAHRLGSESPLPQDLAAEIAKATRILQAFTSDPALPLAPLPTPPPSRDGATQYSDNGVPPPLPPRKNHTLIPLPPSVLRSALGVAIFTSLRLGFNMSGSTGSGILLSRLPDGTWSPPSAISVHSLGAGFMAGGDLSDVICVINTHEAMEAFCRAKVTLGTDIGVAAGPYGMGGGIGVVVEGRKTIEQQQQQREQPQATTIDEEADKEGDEKESEKKQSDKKRHKKEKKQRKASNRGATASTYVRTALGRPVYSYVRSRGLYAGLQVDGTVVTERRDANASFYGARMPASQILAGYVPPSNWVQHVGQLYQVLGDIESRAPALPPRPTMEMSPGAGHADEFYGVPGTGKDQLTEARSQAAAQDEELPRYEGHEPINVSDEKREN